MKFFRETTTGKVVVMGRKDTGEFSEWASIKEPDQYCDHTGIILIRRRMRLLFTALKSALEELKKYDTNDIYVIGGESIYQSAAAMTVMWPM